MFIVTRTELDLNRGNVEVTAYAPEYVMNREGRDHSLTPESLFLYLDPEKETIPMVGEIIKVNISEESDNG